MAKKKIKTNSHTKIKDKHLGKIGTTGHDKFEQRIDVLVEMFKSAEKQRQLTREELGNVIANLKRKDNGLK
jgi:HTH-type transcriptional regulator/antitoxin HipB